MMTKLLLVVVVVVVGKPKEGNDDGDRQQGGGQGPSYTLGESEERQTPSFNVLYIYIYCK